MVVRRRHQRGPAVFPNQRIHMSQGDTSDLSSSAEHHTAEMDEKYLLRSPRQIRRLLSSLIEQRSVVTAHMGGRDQSFPTAVLEVDEDDDWVLLDASANEAVNRTAEQAPYLLCFAQLDRVRVRFRVEELERIEQDGRPAFRIPLPGSLYYLQRREFYRLETPVTDSPTCIIRIPGDAGEQPREFEVRAIDISGGGMAIMLAPGMPLLEVRKNYPDCLLMLPEHPPISLPLQVCSQFKQTLANGSEGFRVGLQFGELPRGADESIQRYIFRVDRQRNARKSGVF